MVELILELILEVLPFIFVTIFLFPVVAILVAPVILIAAFWGKSSYLTNVAVYYGRVFRKMKR